MDLSPRFAAYLLFVSGCAWASIAWILVSRGRRRRSASLWLGAFFTMQALAAGASSLAVAQRRFTNDSEAHLVGLLADALPVARLALMGASFMALVEYGQRRLARHRTWLPGRWTYGLLAVGLLTAPLTFQRGWLELGVKLLIAWAGVVIAALYLRATTRGERLSTRFPLAIFLMALVVSALALCTPLAPLQAAIALLAVVAAWPAASRQQSRPAAPLWRRAAAPTAFGLALVVGWLTIVGIGKADATEVPPQMPAVAELLLEIEPVAEPEQPSALEQQLRRCGLAMAPIVVLVLAVWGLSRLPFVR